MSISPLRQLVLALATTALCSCGGSSGSSAPLPATLALNVPAVEAGEGFIYADGGVYTGFGFAQMGDTGGGNTAAGLLCFDISGLGQVQEAILTFHREDSFGNPWDLGPLHVDHFENDASVDATDYAGGTLTPEAFTIFDQPSWTLDATALVQADIAAGRTTSSFRFRFAVPTNGDATSDLYRIANSTHVIEEWRPSLFIRHVAP